MIAKERKLISMRAVQRASRAAVFASTSRPVPVRACRARDSEVIGSTMECSLRCRNVFVTVKIMLICEMNSSAHRRRRFVYTTRLIEAPAVNITDVFISLDSDTIHIDGGRWFRLASRYKAFQREAAAPCGRYQSAL